MDCGCHGQACNPPGGNTIANRHPNFAHGCDIAPCNFTTEAYDITTADITTADITTADITTANITTANITTAWGRRGRRGRRRRLLSCALRQSGRRDTRGPLDP